MDKTLEELTAIRKELENIRCILEWKFLPDHATKYVDHKPVRILLDPEAQLEALRKSFGIHQ